MNNNSIKLCFISELKLKMIMITITITPEFFFEPQAGVIVSRSPAQMGNMLLAEMKRLGKS